MMSQLEVQKWAGDQNTSPCSEQQRAMHTALLELLHGSGYFSCDQPSVIERHVLTSPAWLALSDQCAGIGLK